MNYFNLLLWFFALIEILYAAKPFNMTSYRRMPPLYQLDEYDACRQSSTGSMGHAYCIVYAEIADNHNNSLWYELRNFSLDRKRHYRHDRLYYGVCLERCARKSLNTTSVQPYDPDIKHSELKKFYDLVYGPAEDQNDDRRKYARLVNDCLNDDFNQKYNLSVETVIEYCNKDNSHLAAKTRGERDLLIGVRAIIALIGLLLVFCSVYDFSLKLKEPKEKRKNFYKNELSSRTLTAITAFSVQRNFYRLINPAQGRLGKDLRFLDGLRSNVMLLIVISHLIQTFMLVPTLNPEYFEKFFHRDNFTVDMSSMAFMQLFFCMSAFLFYVQFKQKNVVTEKTSLWQTIRVAFKLYTYRFLRLMPSVLLVILISTTIYSDYEVGPLWRHLTAPDQQLCRTTWWKQFLLLNGNFMHKHSCIQQTWYVSTDLQLFQIFLVVTLLGAKYPGVKKHLFAFVFMVSCLVPGLVTYFQNMDGTLIVTIESARYLFMESKEFYYSYLPFYMNMAAYLFGILCAEMYLKTRPADGEKPKDLMCSKLLWWLIFPVAYGLLYSSMLFYEFDLPKPSVVSAIYAAFYRPMWSFTFAALILGMCHKFGGFIYNYCSWPMFRVMSRISYQSYLWHAVLIKFLLGSAREPFYFDVPTALTYSIAVNVLANVLGFCVAICFEYPITTVARVYYDVKRVPEHSDDDHLQSVQVPVEKKSSEK